MQDDVQRRCRNRPDGDRVHPNLRSQIGRQQAGEVIGHEVADADRADLAGLQQLGTAREVARAAAQGQVCDVANDNGGAQVVVSGHKSAVERAVAIAQEKGAKRAIASGAVTTLGYPCSISETFLRRNQNQSLEGNLTALEKIRADKEREAADGFDGSWVAHPALVPTSTDVIDEALLTITTTQTFANTWLAWRLGEFQMEHTDLAVRMTTSNDTVDLRSGDADGFYALLTERLSRLP